MNKYQSCRVREVRHTKSIYHMILFIQNLKQAKLIYRDRKEISGCLGYRDCMPKGRKELSGVWKCSIDCSSGYIGALICQSASNCTLKVGAIYCM